MQENQKVQSHSKLNLSKLRNIRRRVVPLASTAAALSLSGCGMIPLWPLGAAPKPALAPAAQNAVTPQSTDKQVAEFTANASQALSNVDPAKLRAVTENKVAPDQVILANTQTAGQGPVSPATAQRAPVITVPVVPAPVPPPPEVRSYDGPTHVSVTTQMPEALPAVPVVSAPPVIPVVQTAAAVETPMYTIFTPKKEGVAGGTVAEASPALVGAIEKDATADPALDAAIEVIRRQALAHPSVNTSLALALLEQSEGRPHDTALAQGLPAVDQQLFQDILVSLQPLNSPMSPTETLMERAAPLVEAAKKWQTETDLSLPKLVLASRVDSYGVYTAVDPKFKTGEKHTVIVYCEVANFSSKKTTDGWFETHLSQQETLATDDGLLLWRPNAEDVEDRSMNQRRDFYIVKKLTIPDNLAAGKYALRMSVTDKNTNKIAVVNLPIEIVGK